MLPDRSRSTKQAIVGLVRTRMNTYIWVATVAAARVAEIVLKSPCTLMQGAKADAVSCIVVRV